MGSNVVHVKLVRVASRGAPLSPPAYQTAGSAGADLQADLERPLTLVPGQRALVPTGFAIELPAGYEAQIRARSGLAVRSGVGLPNSPGTVDSDYRGEIQVALINWGHEPVTIQRGDRIAQLVIAPVARASFELVEALAQTDRGAGGFGSTGKQ
jgi:dUTP pyrophosphatase